MSSKVEKETSVDTEKRKFITKAGKYAAVGAGMATLMTPGVSTAKSYANNGFGNGNQSAPGNSCTKNNAQNAGCP